ncbi:terminase small subunit [Pseudomonas sp. SWRI77]|uniref:terminase small subunit n=1 Tax=Pseudomonas sp. SWRI77 TaxID=2745485 RepID=UPI001647B8B7|nr:terminase small subunit [Pseudomonas sp. SWRI77]MBC3479942.1 terminase small subunit [Pseudomonas sp. SWRI77]
MTYLTKSEFAARHGWSKSYVSKLAKQDRLVLAADGRVDVEATEALLAESADPSKAAVAARHEESRIERDVRSQLQPGGATTSVQPSDPVPGTGHNFQRSKAHREFYLAQLAEAEFHKVQGNLVERLAVEDAAFAAGRMLRDQFFGIAPQLAAELAGMSDPWEIEKHLAGVFRRIFTEAGKMNSADLERAITQS